MQQCKTLLASLTLLALTGRISTEVTNDFSTCNDWFYKNNPPTGFDGISLPVPTEAPVDPQKDPECLAAYRQASPAYICQTILDQNKQPKVFYATLYDRGRRIPLYSAHVLRKGPNPGPRLGFFRQEPQLVHRGPSLKCEMMQLKEAMYAIKLYNTEHKCDETKEAYRPRHKLAESQAVDQDYATQNAGDYDRGHLNPRVHQDGKLQTDATFTFTNVVPMDKTVNKEQWCQHEKEMVNYLNLPETKCNKMHVVTGVVPGNTWIGQDGKARVNVPSHIWNTFCCVDNNEVPRSAKGYLIENSASAELQQMEITDLQNTLKTLFHTTSPISIFSDCNPQLQCEREQTIGTCFIGTLKQLIYDYAHWFTYLLEE